jgi:ATP/maltotriose-dependent transcriptional regulator MalT
MSPTASPLRRTAAKITQPRLARPLTRQRLHKTLDGMLAEHPMVWVAAPAGSGKTSLISIYLKGPGRPTIWYQVDERDDDIASCFHYLTMACAQLDCSEAADLPRYSPALAQDLRAFSRSFFASFFAVLPERTVLVFDNYQEVAEDAALHRVMQVAVEELPTDCRLIVISRHFPPPGYIRLQANQRLAILEQAQLRFEEGEAIALLGLRGSHLSDTPEFKRWLAINRGWAAGLVLYSEWARLVQAEFWRLGSLGAESVFDYFAGEIQARVPEPSARFMAQSALLPVMKPELAAELTDNDAAGEILERLHRHNTFTTRIDVPAVAYEFHPLFRTYLLKQLERSHSPEAFTALSAERQVCLRATDKLRRRWTCSRRPGSGRRWRHCCVSMRRS